MTADGVRIPADAMLGDDGDRSGHAGVCGGAFRWEAGMERHFGDARAATVMAPTTAALYDFIGRLTCGLPLFEESS